MNTHTHSQPWKRLWPLGLISCLLFLFSSVAFGRDFRIPLPPSPERVIRDLRSILHRAAGEVQHSPSRKAHRSDEDDDDNGGADRYSRSPRPAPNVQPTREEDLEMPVPRQDPHAKTSPGIARTPQEPGPTRPPSLDPLSPPPSREATAPAERSKKAPSPEVTASAGKPKDAAAAPKQTVEYATPVPGKHGLVYPPGAQATPENVIDVADYKPGQLVRDPRTGALFRVP